MDGFKDVFSRYLPEPTPAESATSATTPAFQRNALGDDALQHLDCSGSDNGEKARNSGSVADVAFPPVAGSD